MMPTTRLIIATHDVTQYANHQRTQTQHQRSRRHWCGRGGDDRHRNLHPKWCGWTRPRDHGSICGGVDCGGHRCWTRRKRVQRIGSRQSQHWGTLLVLADHVWSTSHVHSMCNRFGLGQCGLSCGGCGGKCGVLAPPSARRSSEHPERVRSGRDAHLDCHRDAHPLGSLWQRGDHRWRDGQSGHPPCLLCLGVSERRSGQTAR